MGYQGERDSLPASASQSWANGTITPFEFWGTIGMSKRFLAQAKTGGGAWYTRYKSEISSFIKDVMTRHEIYAFGDGSGLITYITAVAATGGFENGPNVVITTATNAAAEWQGARKTRKGTRVEFWNHSGDYVKGNWESATQRDNGSGLVYATVTDASVSGSVATITLDTNVAGWSDAAAAGDGMYFHLSRPTTAATASVTSPGLTTLVNGSVENMFASTATLQGLDTTAGFWQSTVLSNSGTNRPVTNTLLQQAIDSAEIRSGGGGEIDLFTSSYGARLGFAVTQLNLRRNTNTTSSPETRRRASRRTPPGSVGSCTATWSSSSLASTSPTSSTPSTARISRSTTGSL